MSQQLVDVEIDARGLACPMPLLKLKLALNQLVGGQVVRLLATDPGSERDVMLFCELAGHHLDINQLHSHEWLFCVTKGGENGA